MSKLLTSLQCGFSSGQWLSRVRVFSTPWTAARQASLSIANSQSLLKLMSNHLILWGTLLPLSIFPSIRVFSNESVLRIRWPNYTYCQISLNRNIYIHRRKRQSGEKEDIGIGLALWRVFIDHCLAWHRGDIWSGYNVTVPGHRMNAQLPRGYVDFQVNLCPSQCSVTRDVFAIVSTRMTINQSY